MLVRSYDYFGRQIASYWMRIDKMANSLDRLRKAQRRVEESPSSGDIQGRVSDNE